MRSISLWAFHHKWQARLLLVCIHVLLIAIAWLTGEALYSMHYSVPASLIYLLVLAYFIGCCCYPSRKQRRRYKNFYRTQKLCDALVATTSFLLIAAASNHQYVFHSPFHSNAAASVQLTNNTNIEKPVKPTGKKISFFKKLKLKLATAILKLRMHFQKASTGEKVALIILAVLLAGLLLFGVFALSCSLSCSGSDALAVLVGILGTALVIFLLVKAIKSINKKYGKKMTGNSTARQRPIAIGMSNN